MFNFGAGLCVDSAAACVCLCCVGELAVLGKMSDLLKARVPWAQTSHCCTCPSEAEMQLGLVQFCLLEFMGELKT